MSLIKVVPYVVGVTPGVPGAPEPRMYPRSGYFLVTTNSIAPVTFRCVLLDLSTYSKASIANVSVMTSNIYVLGT